MDIILSSELSNLQLTNDLSEHMLSILIKNGLNRRAPLAVADWDEDRSALREEIKTQTENKERILEEQISAHNNHLILALKQYMADIVLAHFGSVCGPHIGRR